MRESTDTDVVPLLNVLHAMYYIERIIQKENFEAVTFEVSTRVNRCASDDILTK